METSLHPTASAMSYEEASAYLGSLQFFRIKLGLDTMRQLLQELGAPQERLRVIHIAGTNGKGSVGATLRTLLTQAGYRAGFYSSPTWWMCASALPWMARLSQKMILLLR